MDKTIRKAAELIAGSRYLICLTGAGISVESGIPPFRGPGGVWTKHGEPPMDGYQRFLADPKGFWEQRLRKEGYAREIYEKIETAKPNPAHQALAQMEEKGHLKFLITQNIDNLHLAAGSRNVAEIHGNYTLVRCIQCHRRTPREEVPVQVLPPVCPECGGIFKTDVVIFGEPIPPDVLSRCEEEAAHADGCLVVGTSATVYPAAGFPIYVKRGGGFLIEVNLFETEYTEIADVSLLGEAGKILPVLVKNL